MHSPYTFHEVDIIGIRNITGHSFQDKVSVPLSGWYSGTSV